VAFVDIDEVIPGSIDETTGAVTFSAADDAVHYGVVDEIARRVWLSGGAGAGRPPRRCPGREIGRRDSALRAACPGLKPGR
jgi:hypothetical protein